MHIETYFVSESNGHVLQLFSPSSFIVKWLCLKLKNRPFRVIQQYERYIYSESSHQEQSFKKNKNDMSCVY